MQVVFFLRRDLNGNESCDGKFQTLPHNSLHSFQFTLELFSRAEKLVNLSLYNERSTQVKRINSLYRVSPGFKHSFPFGRWLELDDKVLYCSSWPCCTCLLVSQKCCVTYLGCYRVNNNNAFFWIVFNLQGNFTISEPAQYHQCCVEGVHLGLTEVSINQNGKPKRSTRFVSSRLRQYSWFSRFSYRRKQDQLRITSESTDSWSWRTRTLGSQARLFALLHRVRRRSWKCLAISLSLLQQRGR